MRWYSIFLAIVLACGSAVLAAPESASIAINFGTEAAQSGVNGNAGVLGTNTWNNLFEGQGDQVQLVGNVDGERVPVETTLDWSFGGVRRSMGVDVPQNPEDQNLMSGHLFPAGEVRVTGLTEHFKHGYDVYVYTYGGPPGLLHEYKISTPAEEQVARSQTPDFFAGDYVEGETFVLFRGVFGDSFLGSFGGSVTAMEIDAADYNCLAGDFNNDGVVDVKDIDLMTQQIKSGIYDACYDLNNDGVVDQSDCESWVNDIAQICPGDANFDGEFNSNDLIFIFQKGQYEDDIECNSTWATGDWNCDGEFNSNDLVVAFQQGWYEKGQLAVPANGLDGALLGAASSSSVSAVPEPTSLSLLLIAVVPFLHRRRNTKSRIFSDCD